MRVDRGDGQSHSIAQVAEVQYLIQKQEIVILVFWFERENKQGQPPQNRPERRIGLGHLTFV